jgi:hypothetical protein
MSKTINKWRLWCNTEMEWKDVWGDENAPITCPDNITHEIDPTKTVITDNITQDFPISEVGGKVWVHSSSKPVLQGNRILYVQWTGRGDDVVNHVLGGAPDGLLHFECVPGQTVSYKDVKFDQSFGDIYIHEGYVSWHGAGNGDCVSADILAEPSLLQPFVNKDLIVNENGYVLYSPEGPGTGTHGFAATPQLLSRSFSHDGEWNYTPSTGLTPNFSNTGEWRISIHESPVHTFMRDIPVYGTNPTLFRLVCDESFRLPGGYFLRIRCHNNSDTSWHATVLITIYRERTYQP